MDLYQHSQSLRGGREEKRERQEKVSFSWGKWKIEERLEPEKQPIQRACHTILGVFWRLLISHTRSPENPLVSFLREKLEIECDAAAHGNELRPLFSRLIWARQAMMLRWPVMREPAGQDGIWYEYVYTLSLSRNSSPTPDSGGWSLVSSRSCCPCQTKDD